MASSNGVNDGNAVADTTDAAEGGSSSAGTNANPSCGNASASDASDNAGDAGSGAPRIEKFGGR